MAWEGLFADLEAQWAAAERRELDAEVADRTRRERALVDLVARLAASVGSPATVRLVVGPPVRGVVDDVGDGWVVLRSGRASVLVVLDAVVGVDGLAPRADAAVRARRFGVGYALRGISRDRAVVTVLDRAGGTTSGTIDAVGADHLDVSVHHLDQPRRAANVQGRRTVPVAGLVSVTAG